VTAVDLAGLLDSAPDANRRAAAIASGLPPETPAPAVAAALVDSGRIAAIVRTLSPRRGEWRPGLPFWVTRW
jgi:hypothetical protein